MKLTLRPGAKLTGMNLVDNRSSTDMRGFTCFECGVGVYRDPLDTAGGVQCDNPSCQTRIKRWQPSELFE